jgi:nucleoid-associated protein YgaU
MISRPAGALQSSQPVLSGTAAPRSTVRIYAGNYLLGETQADARGRWVFVPPIALAVGKHTLRVASIGPDGQEVPGGTVELTVAEGATGLKPLTFTPSTGKAPSPVGILQGTAPPDTIVSIYEGDILLAKVLADAKGLWQYPLPARTRSGQHTYHIVVATRDGVILYRSDLTTVTIS